MENKENNFSVLYHGCYDSAESTICAAGGYEKLSEKEIREIEINCTLDACRVYPCSDEQEEYEERHPSMYTHLGVYNSEEAAWAAAQEWAAEQA